MAKGLTRNSEILWRIIEDKVVLLDMDEARTIILNEVGSCIWIELEAEKEINELIIKVTAGFDIDEETARKDVSTFIDDMIKRDLIKVV